MIFIPGSKQNNSFYYLLMMGVCKVVHTQRALTPNCLNLKSVKKVLCHYNFLLNLGQSKLDKI